MNIVAKYDSEERSHTRVTGAGTDRETLHTKPSVTSSRGAAGTHMHYARSETCEEPGAATHRPSWTSEL